MYLPCLHPCDSRGKHLRLDRIQKLYSEHLEEDPPIISILLFLKWIFYLISTMERRRWNEHFNYFKEKLAGVESSERSLFSGFKDNGVTTSKSRTNFPSKHQKRKVPWNDLSSNSYGFMQCLNMIVSVSWNCKPMNLIRPPYTLNRNQERSFTETSCKTRNISKRFDTSIVTEQSGDHWNLCC